MQPSPQTATSPTRAFGALRAACKLGGVLLASAVIMPVQALLLLFTRGSAAFYLPQCWHRCVCAVLGLRVEVVGRREVEDAMFYVGNHISHFDIPVVGSVMRACFTAKNDMEQWPGIPAIAALQQTIFVSRKARDATKVAASVSNALQRGHRLVLFAEGTTSNGTRVAPFKSSLFALVCGNGTAPAEIPTPSVIPTVVQPFTIELREVDGHPLGDDADRDLYTFHGDMDAGAHLKRFLRSRGARLRITFHPPIGILPGMDRKMLAAATHAAVASALHATPAV